MPPSVGIASALALACLLPSTGYAATDADLAEIREQILWAQPLRLMWAAVVYAVILALWFGARERMGQAGFYALFAVAVTVSVQLVGLYLVFATLIVPPLATRRMGRRRLPAAWSLGLAGYAVGLVASTALDLPSCPVIVWVLVALALVWQTATRPRQAAVPSVAS